MERLEQTSVVALGPSHNREPFFHHRNDAAEPRTPTALGTRPCPPRDRTPLCKCLNDLGQEEREEEHEPEPDAARAREEHRRAALVELGQLKQRRIPRVRSGRFVGRRRSCRFMVDTALTPLSDQSGRAASVWRSPPSLSRRVWELRRARAREQATLPDAPHSSASDPPTATLVCRAARPRGGARAAARTSAGR